MPSRNSVSGRPAVRFSFVALAGALTFVPACGGSVSPSGGTPGPAGGAAGPSSGQAADIAAYQVLAQQVRAEALTYRASMLASSMTLADCSPTHDEYDATVRPWISQMVWASSEMDAFMNSHEGNAVADMQCIAGAMMSDLDAHARVACTYADLGADQAEAARDADAIASYATHAFERCGQMMNGLDGHGYVWGSMMGGCSSGAGEGGGGGGVDPLALGQRIFDLGTGVDGRPIAHTGGVGMGMMNACASCHGLDGHGRRTMMFTAPNITYPNLTDPSGMLESDGTRGPTYTDDLIHRAVVQGIGGDGAALDTTMPRWQLGDEDWADLLAYLKTLR